MLPYSLEQANSGGFFNRQLLRLFSVQFVDTVIFELRNAKLRVLAPVQARRFRGQKDLLVQVGCGRWSIARIAGSSTSTIR